MKADVLHIETRVTRTRTKHNLIIMRKIIFTVLTRSRISGTSEQISLLLLYYKKTHPVLMILVLFNESLKYGVQKRPFTFDGRVCLS